MGYVVLEERQKYVEHLMALPKAIPSYRLIDLFSGCGGLASGFLRTNQIRFRCVWANDIDPSAATTYNANFGPHCQVGDIVEILNDPRTAIPRADIVIGGPPCQGFSLLNKNRAIDPRKQLWRQFMEVVDRSRANVFVMENVPQLLSEPEYAQIIQEANRLGFQVHSAKLCAADFGVPQTRHRAFIVGCRYMDPAFCFPPMKTHCNPQSVQKHEAVLFASDFVDSPRPWRTVRDAIRDLPYPVGTEIRSEDAPLDLHFGRTPTPMSVARYEAIPKEGMNRFDLLRNAPELTPPCWVRKESGGTDLFGRLWWDRPAFTIRTEFFKPEKGRYLHPEQHRPITHREAARFQSFPDDFRFLGTKVEIAKQIGNAVPPGLASAVAKSVLDLLALRQIS